MLIVLWDTVRADRLSLYGHARGTTPHLDAFAAGGTVYERAVSPANWTLPAHASLFTGLWVSEHGATAKSMRLAAAHETLAERLAAAGYDTFAFTANPHASRATGLLQGFDTVERSWEGRWAEHCAASAEARLIDGDRSTRFSPRGPRFGRRPPVYKDCAEYTDDALFAWLDARADPQKPFFAFLSYMEAHVPRLASRAARRQVLSEAEIERTLAVNQEPMRQFRHMFGLAPYSEAELRAISDGYDAALAELDRGGAQLFEALEARGLLEETLVIVTSDHGEHLGEHGQLDHKYSLYDALVHVPLLLRHPDHYPPGRVSGPVSTRAVAGTILALSGVEPDAPRLPAPGGVGPGVVFAELREPVRNALHRALRRHPEVDRSPWLAGIDAIVRRDAKLIERSDGRRELFETGADDDPSRNLVRQRPERAAELARELADWRSGLAPLLPAPSQTPDIDAAARAQLEALGYLQDDLEPDVPRSAEDDE